MGPPVSRGLFNTDRLDESFRSLIAASPDPQATLDRVQSAYYLAEIVGRPMDEVFRHYEYYHHAHMGEPVTSQPTALRAIGDQWRLGQIAVERARIGARLWMDPTNEEAREQLRALAERTPPPDEVQRSLPVQMLKAIANVVPFSLSSLAGGLQTGLAGAAGAGLAAGVAGQLGPQALLPEEALTVPSAALWGFTAGRRAGSAAEAARLAAGLVVADAIEQADAAGVTLDPSMLRVVSAGAGALSGLLEAAQLERLTGGNRVLTRALQRSIRNTVQREVVRQSGTQVARRFAATYASGVAMETLQEIAQESVEFIAVELTKELQQQLDGSRIPRAQAEDFMRLVAETARQSALAFAGLGLPGAVVSTSRSLRTERSIRASLATIGTDAETTQAVEQAIQADALRGMDDEQVSATLERVAQSTPVAAGDIDITQTDKGITVRSQSREVVTIDIADDAGEIRIEGIDSVRLQPEAARAVLTRIQELEPTRRIRIDTDTDTGRQLARLLEDQHPELAALNTQIDTARAIIEDTESVIVETREELASLRDPEADGADGAAVDATARIAELEETLTEQRDVAQAMHERIARIESVKARFDAIDTRPEWALDAEQSADRAAQEAQADATPVTDRASVAPIREQLSALGLSDAEVDATLSVIDRRAAALDMSREAFANQYIAGIERGQSPGMVSRGAPASMEIVNDGRALIRASEAATFRDVLEEVLHVVQRTLTPAERTQVAQLVGQADPDAATWARPAQERFVALVERYLSDRTAPSAELQTVFEKIADLVERFVTDLRERIGLTPEARQVVEQLFTPRTEASANPKADIEAIMVRLSKEYSGDEAGYDRALVAEGGRIRSLARQIERTPDAYSTTGGTGGAYVTGVLDRLTQAEQTTGTQAQEVFAQSEERIREVRDAVERFEPVPTEVLEEFAGYGWAERELTYRTEVEQRRETFVDLYERAREAGSVDDFVRTTITDMDADGASRDVQRFLEDIYFDATVDDVQAGNLRWIQSLTDAEVRQAAITLVERGEASVPARVVAARIRDGKPVNERMVKAFRSRLRNAATRMRQVLAQGNEVESRRLQLERLKGNATQTLDGATVDAATVERSTYTDLAGRFPELAKDTAFRRMVAGSMTAAEVAKLAEDLDRILSDTTAKAAAQERARQKREAAQRYRDEMRRLGRILTRKLPKNIDIDYREQIEDIQRRVDPKFRQDATIARRDSLLAWLERNPEARDSIPGKVLQEAISKPLDEWNIESLQDLIETTQHLIKLGQTKYRLRVEKRQNRIAREIRAIERNLSAPVPDGSTIIRERRTFRDTMRRLVYSTWRPSRIADLIDGGKNFTGPTHELFINEVNRATERELRNRTRREKRVHDALERNLITMQDLARKRDIDGFTEAVSLDEMMDVWVKWKNERSRAALMYGNRITERMYKAIDRELTKAEKDAALAIVGDYDAEYNRLRDAHRTWANQDPGREDFYTPLIRMNRDYTKLGAQLRDEALIRAGLRRAKPERGFTVKRIQISPEHQKPVRLGLYGTWAEQIVKQEHYIESAEHVFIMDRVLADPKLQAAIRDTVGGEAHRELKEAVSRFANPTAHMAFNPYRSTLSKLRQNTAIAFLLGNAVTLFKQLPSVAFYMGESSPAHVMSGVWQAATQWKQTRDFILERDAQMRERGIDRAYDELRALVGQNALGRGKAQVVRKGFALIQAMDALATTAGWKAVFDAKIAEGLSEAEAIEAARNATLRTQPASAPKDTATVLSNESLYMLTQFSNQLNQIWNAVSYDIPMRMRNGYAASATWQMLGIALSAYAMWALANRRPVPEDGEDWKELISSQMLNLIPVYGPVAAGITQGFQPEVTALTPAKTAVSIGQLIAEATTGEIENPERAAWDIYEGIAIASGLPYILPRRIARGIEEADRRGEGWPTIAQYILFGGKWYASKAEQERAER